MCLVVTDNSSKDTVGYYLAQWVPHQGRRMLLMLFPLFVVTFISLLFLCPAALTGNQAESSRPDRGLHQTAGETRLRRATTEDTYWAYSGMCGDAWMQAADVSMLRMERNDPDCHVSIVIFEFSISTEAYGGRLR